MQFFEMKNIRIAWSASVASWTIFPLSRDGLCGDRHPPMKKPSHKLCELGLLGTAWFKPDVISVQAVNSADSLGAFFLTIWFS